MEKLIIDKSIVQKGHFLCTTLDKEEEVFKVYGYMLENKEETNTHFIKINNWIDEYINEPNEKTDFYFQFLYINTMGIKKIHELIRRIRIVPNINFYLIHDPDDEDREEMVSEISSHLDVNITSKKVSLDYQTMFSEKPYYI